MVRCAQLSGYRAVCDAIQSIIKYLCMLHTQGNLKCTLLTQVSHGGRANANLEMNVQNANIKTIEDENNLCLGTQWTLPH